MKYDGKRVEILLPDGSPTGLIGIARFSQQLGLSRDVTTNVYSVSLEEADVQALEECSRQMTGMDFFKATAGVNMLEEYLRLAA